MKPSLLNLLLGSETVLLFLFGSKPVLMVLFGSEPVRLGLAGSTTTIIELILKFEFDHCQPLGAVG
jgi:hypothetical protein